MRWNWKWQNGPKRWIEMRKSTTDWPFLNCRPAGEVIWFRIKLIDAELWVRVHGRYASDYMESVRRQSKCLGGNRVGCFFFFFYFFKLMYTADRSPCEGIDCHCVGGRSTIQLNPARRNYSPMEIEMKTFCLAVFRLAMARHERGRQQRGAVPAHYSFWSFHEVCRWKTK